MYMYVYRAKTIEDDRKGQNKGNVYRAATRLASHRGAEGEGQSMERTSEWKKYIYRNNKIKFFYTIRKSENRINVFFFNYVNIIIIIFK